DGGNYSLELDPSLLDGLLADITAFGLTLTIDGSFQVADKVYDGSRSASITQNNLFLNGVLGGEDVDLDAVASFLDANAGDDKLVTLLNSRLKGDDAGNYELDLSSAPTTTANIGRRSLTLDDLSVLDKVYDGDTAAQLTFKPAGLIGNDTVSFDYRAAFNDKNVGAGKTVNVIGQPRLSGGDARNYRLNLS